MADDHPCCAATIAAVIEQLEQLDSELIEQCRLSGMGSEREASMLAQIERLQRENARLKRAAYEAMHMADDLAALRKECARLQMELDSTCNAEELRQVRAENATLREDKVRIEWMGDMNAAELRELFDMVDHKTSVRMAIDKMAARPTSEAAQDDAAALP